MQMRERESDLVIRRSLRGTVLSAASMILCFHVFAIPQSAGAATSLRISFDGGAEPPSITSEKVNLVKGLSGMAAHLGRDSLLEYSSSLPGFLTPTAGTFMVWFKHDYTIPSGLLFRDRDRAENLLWQHIPGSSWYYRCLFASGDRATIFGGINLSAFMGGCAVEYGWCRRVLDGEWHHLAFTYDAAAAKSEWFVDGMPAKPMGGADFTGAMSFEKTFTLGSGGGRPGLEGAIDEICFLPHALDAKAILAEYHRHQPVRYELHDWSVGAGETKKFRFRARNESAASVKKTVRLSTGAMVDLSLEPDELTEFAIDVRGGNPGLFKIWINEGETDARQFECMCLGEESRSAQNRRRTLIGGYDCTKENPKDRVAVCVSQVVTNGALTYLESLEGQSVSPLVACRFWIRNQGRPHVLELDYPDDKARSFIAAVYPEKWGRIYAVTTDAAGVMTGIDYPLSNAMQTKRIVFWPDSETVCAVVQNYTDFGGPGVVESPAACAAMRLYELDGLPSGPVRGMSAGARSVAVWDEDPTIDASLVAAQAFNYERVDLDFWRIKWRRIIDYMRWNSMDSWVIKAMAYNGDSTGMDATLPEAALPLSSDVCSDGRCRGWAELGADMLSRAGMGFWVRMNHRVAARGDPWFAKLGGGKPEDNILLGLSGGGFDRGVPNFLVPSVRNAYRRIVAAYRDKYGRYPGFRGVAMSEMLPVHFIDIDRGYDDFTISCFTRDTGTAVPATDAKGRHAWLTGDPKRLEKWLAWRCDATAKFAEELAGVLREKGGDGQIQIWYFHFNYTHKGGRPVKWEEWDAARAMRGAGLDGALLSKIPGVMLVPCVAPDRARRDAKGFDDQEYFRDSPSWVETMRRGGIDAVNVYRHANFEVWPRIGDMGGSARAWKTDLWLPAGHNVAFRNNFQSYATPHARPPYTVDSVASLVADADVQDLFSGFWGLTEVGEGDEWSRFYGQFRRIPRGRHALAKGPDDPVCVRSGAEGHYLVNREPYPVEVEYVVDGNPVTLNLEQHEIRFVKGRGANGAVEVKRAKVPDVEKAAHLANLEKLEASARGDAENASLVRAAKEARDAFDDGRFHQFRALFRLGAVRRAMHPELYEKTNRN